MSKRKSEVDGFIANVKKVVEGLDYETADPKKVTSETSTSP